MAPNGFMVGEKKKIYPNTLILNILQIFWSRLFSSNIDFHLGLRMTINSLFVLNSPYLRKICYQAKLPTTGRETVKFTPRKPNYRLNKPIAMVGSLLWSALFSDNKGTSPSSSLEQRKPRCEVVCWV